MKRLLVLLAALATVPAFAQANGTAAGRTFSSALTGSAPTLADDGVDLSGASGYVVVLSAPASQTITGGSLLCYYRGCVAWNSAGNACLTLRWMRCPSSLDFTPGTGVLDAPSGDFSTPAGYGRIKYVPSSVTVSSGSTVTISITARKTK